MPVVTGSNPVEATKFAIIAEIPDASGGQGEDWHMGTDGKGVLPPGIGWPEW
ncbi:hypothetical protein [Salmonella phage SKML-39]|uniref:Uncharacterized protein n=1 Tax=Salmonella phage SKML-39 TaxID=1204528 RepID=K4I3U0_9CAUD|nr:hypothetical protein G178_gp200 [Salmonella phage SKML-39]AFU64543.1 hypothetical protein [Salmonella phage SKML-39]